MREGWRDGGNSADAVMAHNSMPLMQPGERGVSLRRYVSERWSASRYAAARQTRWRCADGGALYYVRQEEAEGRY